MIIRADPFELDREAFELRRDGVRAPVEPLVLNLIFHLAENRHRLVSRAELVEVIWQRRAVSDWAVSTAIKAARRALGDTSTPRRFIRTVHGKGLRFVAAAADTEAPAAQPVALAVVPFRSLGTQPSEAYFADGVSEDLMIDLGRIDGLRVAPRHASFRFRGSPAPPSEIGRALQADHLLMGSVRRSDRELRINAELVRAETGAQLWSDRFSSGRGDALDLQEAICARIVASLKLHFAAPRPRRATSSPAAYDLCLKGRWEYFSYSPDGFAQAAEHFSEAVVLDPDYAEALAYLSYCRTSTYVFAWPGSDATLGPALELAERAVALDPDSAVVQARHGWVLGFLGRSEAAIAAFERAIARDPGNPEALHNYGETLNRLCKPLSAEPVLERAFAIDRYVPPSWAMALGHTANLLARYDTAAERLEDVLQRVPGFVPARVQLVRALAALGRKADARAAVDRIRTHAPRYRIGNAVRMFPYPDSGQRRALLDALRAAGLPE